MPRDASVTELLDQTATQRDGGTVTRNTPTEGAAAVEVHRALYGRAYQMQERPRRKACLAFAKKRPKDRYVAQLVRSNLRAAFELCFLGKQMPPLNWFNGISKTHQLFRAPLAGFPLDTAYGQREFGDMPAIRKPYVTTPEAAIWIDRQINATLVRRTKTTTSFFNGMTD